MTFEEFQHASRRTQCLVESPRERVLLFALGLANESGEVCGVIKKWMRQGPAATWDRAELLSECGDVLWYLSTLASVCDISLDEIARTNLTKLQARYPEGFASQEAAHAD